MLHLLSSAVRIYLYYYPIFHCCAFLKHPLSAGVAELCLLALGYLRLVDLPFESLKNGYLPSLKRL